MRLSDIRGERVYDVIADIIGPIADIASDEDVMGLFTPENLPKGMTPQKFMLERAKKAVPSLTKKYKQQLTTILASLANVSAEEYLQTLTLGKFTTDIIELLTDESFAELFTDAQKNTNNSDN